MKYSCEKCEYQTDRPGNLERHKQTHSKERIQCDCGKLLSEAALWRHKKNACPIKSTKTAPVIDHNALSEKVVKVETNVRVQQKDGHVWFNHDPIVIDGIQLVLIPAASIVTMDAPSMKDDEPTHDVNLNGVNGTVMRYSNFYNYLQ